MKQLITLRMFLSGVGILLLATACQTPTTTPPVEEIGVQVRKSPNDSRDYRYLVLDNALRVLLVSDPATDKSAAAMAVYRGSFHEPENRPGLAHFLEHMLFIQTEAYPEPGAFQQFVAANGGSTNAYTALDHTNYFFDVQPDAFPAALDRWAHFFIAPIISAEYSDREKNAVHSEYQMQYKDDGWRGYMVGKQALNPEHPARRFTIGSLQTLAGDVQADLKALFDEQYSADQMGLVLISSQSLDELEALVTPLFGQIANKDIGPAYIDIPMYAPGQLPIKISNQTQKDGYNLTYAFPLPSTLPHYRSKPEQYFANLIGHEGTGSLYQYLTRQGWIESLGSGLAKFDRGTTVLNINMSLTELGAQNQQQIGRAIFAYIDLLRDTEPQAWLYKEQATVAELGFKFQEKSSPTGLVYRLAPELDNYAAEDLLVATYLMEEFDAGLIKEYLTYLTPENLVVEYSAPDVEGDKIEPWFQVPFSIEPFALQPSEQAYDFALPEPNPFLPENTDLVPADEDAIASTGDAQVSLWLDTDVRFGSPRSNVRLELIVPGGFESPADRAQAQLYRALVQDSLSELVYPAYLAGLNYSIGVPDSGFSINLGGYADKQQTLLAAVIEGLLDPVTNEDRFQLVKASLMREWQNAKKERPFRQTFASLEDTLRSGRWPREMLIAAAEPITLPDLLKWKAEKLTDLTVQGLVHGSIEQAPAEELIAVLKRELPLADQPSKPYRAQVREVPASLRLELPIDHNDSSFVLHVQDDDASFRSRAKSMLAGQMIQPEYFRQLRTEQQLGYVVIANARPIVDRGGLTFIVQSPVASAAALTRLTREFIDNFAATPLSDEDFAQQKSGLINRLTEKPKNLSEQTQRYWADLVRDHLSFDSRAQIAQEVERLTIADMAAYLKSLADKAANKGLLIFSRGKFDEIPSLGAELESPVAEFP